MLNGQNPDSNFNKPRPEEAWNVVVDLINGGQCDGALALIFSSPQSEQLLTGHTDIIGDAIEHSARGILWAARLNRGQNASAELLTLRPACARAVGEQLRDILRYEKDDSLSALMGQWIPRFAETIYRDPLPNERLQEVRGLTELLCCVEVANFLAERQSEFPRAYATSTARLGIYYDALGAKTDDCADVLGQPLEDVIRERAHADVARVIVPPARDKVGVERKPESGASRDPG